MEGTGEGSTGALPLCTECVRMGTYYELRVSLYEPPMRVSNSRTAGRSDYTIIR